MKLHIFMLIFVISAFSHVAFSAPSLIERNASLVKRQSSSAASTKIASSSNGKHPSAFFKREKVPWDIAPSDERHASLFKRQSSKTASMKVAKSSNGEADLPMM